MSEPLPLIIATCRGRSVAIPRPTLTEGMDVYVSIEYQGNMLSLSPSQDHLRKRLINMFAKARIMSFLEDAFPNLEGRSYVIEARLPGMQTPVAILPSLWSSICAVVADIHVQVLLNEEGPFNSLS